MLLIVKFKTTKHKQFPQMRGEITIDPAKTPVMPLGFKELIHKNMLPEYPLDLIQIASVKAVS